MDICMAFIIEKYRDVDTVKWISVVIIIIFFNDNSQSLPL